MVLIFPKDHFVPGEKRTHLAKPCLGESPVSGCQLLGNTNKNTHGGYVVRTLIINSQSMSSRDTFDKHSDS